MQLVCSFLIGFVLFTSFHANSSETLGELVDEKIQYYKVNGPSKTADYWTSSKNNPKPILDGLQKIEYMYGGLHSYDVIATDKVSPRVSLVIAALNYDNGAAFMRMQWYFSPSNKWVLMHVAMNTEPFGLLPNMITFQDRLNAYYDE